MVKAKIHLSRYNESSQPYDCNFFWLFFFFLRLWHFASSGYPSRRIVFTKSRKALHYPFLRVFVCIMCLHNVINWLIWSTAFFFLLNKWSLISLMEFEANHFAHIKSRHLDNPNSYIIVHMIPLFIKVRAHFLLKSIHSVCKKEMLQLKAAQELFFFSFFQWAYFSSHY